MMHSTITKTPSATMTRAYNLGREYAASGQDLASWMYSLSSDDCGIVGGESAVLGAFFAAGEHGTAVPSWSRGWRYGQAPASGQSYNYRDQRLEAGISMMSVEGCDYESDGTYAMFNGTGPRVEVKGWLVTHTRGTDGEPLIVR